MKRMTRVSDTAESANAARTAQARFTSKSREGMSAQSIDGSPAMVAQRLKLHSLFGGAIQRVEEEEPLQGKFAAVQRVEEEELLQGKFDTAQRVEEEEPLQGKFETAQRVEDEEPLQGKFEPVQRVEEEEPLQGKFEAASAQLKEGAAKPNNTGLPDKLKSGIESLSGMSMDNVKVHYNSSQPAQLNALAYAQGTDIHVAPGQERHLPHEAWHVVQQAQGRVQPTMQMKEGMPVNDDQSLEHEADVMGARILVQGGGQKKTQDDVGLIAPPPKHRDIAQLKASAFRVSESDLIGLAGPTTAGAGVVQREKMKVMLGGKLPRVDMEVTFSESASNHVGSDEVTLKSSTLQALAAEGISTEDQGGGVHRFKINNGKGYLVYRRNGNNVTVFHFHWNYTLDDPLNV